MVAKKPRKKKAENSVFSVVTGTATFSPSQTERILQIATAQSSAGRKAYRFQQKNPEATTAETASEVMPNFEDNLNRFYYNSIQGDIDRLLKAKSNVIFGGKKNWKLLQDGKLSRKEWLAIRNHTLVSAGDQSKNGNRNIQVFEKDGSTKIRVNDPVARGAWIVGDIRMHQRNIPADTWICYRTHLKHIRGLKFLVTISVMSAKPLAFTPRPGCIGIDINPNHIDWVETDASGNVIDQGIIWLHRMTTAKQGKRQNDARMAAIELSQLCIRKQKLLAHEKLNFGNKKKRTPYAKRYTSFNRMRHNFSYRLILDAIHSRLKKDAVPFKEVIAAYSSILGIAKFSRQKGMNRHGSAALVIARRGMGIERERQNFSIDTIQPRPKDEPRKTKKLVSGRPLQAETSCKRGMVIRLKPKAIETLTRCFLRDNASLDIRKNGGVHFPLSRKPAKPAGSRKTNTLRNWSESEPSSAAS